MCFGFKLKVGPSLGGVPANKDELLEEMKTALFVRLPNARLIPEQPDYDLIAELLDYDRAWAAVRGTSGAGALQIRTDQKRATTTACLAFLNKAVEAALR